MNDELNKIREEMQAMKTEYMGKMESYFNEQIKKLFSENPKLNEFSVDVSNHEFNDGDATYFSVDAECPSINGIYSYDLGDEEELKEANLTPTEVDELSTKINDLFEAFDGEDLEVMFSEEYESITFKRESSE